RFGWKTPLAVIVAAVALAVTAAAIGKLDHDTALKSLGYRLQYWRSSLDMIDDHPWLGCGPGNFQDAYTRYKLPEASEEVADPHNFLFEIWTTAGTPAALAFLAVLGCFAWTIFRGGGRGAGDGGWRAEGGGRRAEEITKSQIPNPKSPVPRPPPPAPDAWPFVLAGGAVGFLLSLPLGMLSAAPPGATVVLLGFPLAGAAVALLLGWIREGRLPRLLPALAVAVLLMNLLTAGGIGMPGVAGSFWLLMALGLVGQQPRLLRTVWAWAALSGAIALAVACYATAYSPVLGCQAQLRLSESKPTRAIKHLEAAAAADPWATEPWRRLAAVEFDNWRRSPTNDAYQRFERAAANLTRLAPNSAQSWSAIGDWYSQAASITNRSGNRIAGNAVSKAVEAYRRTVDLYPNSALNRAKLAEAYRTAGDREAYCREAETALRLDKATPHADKKLPAALRDRLKHNLSDK
ncbi:MAG: O-antigen ligase family protein, partial [Planctomycetes bacterium]|nr:O-antigen ligase family protein [Planctomycetota bacterium]MCG2683678.1 O-antigen ligase family protein [Planctomycetales bacterium]